MTIEAGYGVPTVALHTDKFDRVARAVAAQNGMQQADGMHPTFAGVKRIVSGITPSVKAALGKN